MCGGAPGAGTRYVTVVIDLAPARDSTGPCWLVGMVEACGEKVFKGWLAQRDQVWRDGVEVWCDGRIHGFQDRRHGRGAA